MKNPIVVPEGTRFTCQGCGRCCQGWTVPVDQQTVDRLRAHDWGGEPFEPLKGGGAPFRIKLVGGRCYFLDAQSRCRIHTELAYEAKPPVCKAFPLAVLDVEGRQYARLSYWCPTATDNTGRPLEQQARWLKDTAAIAERRAAPLTIDGEREISVRELERVHQALRRFVGDATMPIRDRLGACAALIGRLRESAGDVESVVKAADRAGIATLAREGLSGGTRSSGRRVLTLYLLHDRPNGRWTILPRLAAVVLFNAGLWPLTSRTIGARATWRALRRVAFDPSPASTELLTRYFTTKIESRRYLAGEVSVAKGFNLLLAAYAMVEVLARTRAAAAGRTACDEEDIRHAVSAADLLVVEHPGLDQSGLHRRMTDAALGGAEAGTDLLAVV